jgi:hypothetical protein
MPFTKENRQKFESLRKKHGIIFDLELPQNKWPKEHRDVLEAIEKIKNFKYHSYAADEGADLEATPWKLDAKSQAVKLTGKVKDCVGRNESTWRFGCESVVFSRFAAEIAWYQLSQHSMALH